MITHINLSVFTCNSALQRELFVTQTEESCRCRAEGVRSAIPPPPAGVKPQFFLSPKKFLFFGVLEIFLWVSPKNFRGSGIFFHDFLPQLTDLTSKAFQSGGKLKFSAVSPEISAALPNLIPYFSTPPLPGKTSVPTSGFRNLLQSPTQHQCITNSWAGSNWEASIVMSSVFLKKNIQCDTI